MKGAKGRSTCQRFFAMIDSGECWEWSGQRVNGYGRFQLNDRNRTAHQVAYELFVGPIPEGLEIDHLCRNRACVNPTHMELVTHRENVLRGETIAARNFYGTECVNGHPWSPETTGRRHDGGRFCRPCARERNRVYKQRKREERAA